MRRLRWIPLAVLLLGAAEFLALAGMVRLIGAAPAVIALVVLSLLGGYLVRREGLRGWRRLRASVQERTPVGAEALNSVAGLIAALLLLFPGYLTALAGLIMLIPPVRGLVAGRLRKATERRVPSHVAGDLFGPRQARVKKTQQPSSDEVIEGEIID